MLCFAFAFARVFCILVGISCLLVHIVVVYLLLLYVGSSHVTFRASYKFKSLIWSGCDTSLEIGYLLGVLYNDLSGWSTNYAYAFLLSAFRCPILSVIACYVPVLSAT